MGEAGAPIPSWMELWNEWEIQTVVVTSFSLQVILFFFAGIRRYSVSFVTKALLWLVYLLADVVATYALGHMSSSLSKSSSSEHQLVAFWAPFLLLHLGGQDTITAYALEDNKLWLRHLLNMFVQVVCTAYVLYKYIIAGGATFVHAAMLVLAAGVFKYGERIWALKLASKGGSRYKRRRRPNTFRRRINDIRRKFLTKKHVDVLTDEPSDTLTDEPIDTAPRSAFAFAQAMKRVHARLVSVNAFVNHLWVDRKVLEIEEGEERDCFTKNKQFGTYVFIVMIAHTLRHVLVKPVIIDRNDASIDWSDPRIGRLTGYVQGYLWEDAEIKLSAEEKGRIWEMYKAIEVQLALMYDMLYTKAEVIHTRYGHCIRAISLVSCFTALTVFTKSKRDGYSTPDIVITFALLGGACALEMASIFKAIGSTWTCAILRRHKWKWLANAILFARYHLVVVKDGRWSNSVGQFNFISFCVHSRKRGLKGRVAGLVGLRDFWIKTRCTKHAKLSPAMKGFVWGLLKGDKSHMVRIEDVAIRRGYWACKFSGIAQIKQLDWSMSFEFHESVLIWHIATGIILNNPVVKSQLVGKDKNMAEALNTLSDYLMYLLVKHADILPSNPDAQNLFDKACYCYGRRYPHHRYNADEYHQIILDYKEGPPESIRVPDFRFQKKKDYDEYVSQGEAVLVKAGNIAHTMLDMKLGLTVKMAIIGTVWTEMLRYAATNATEGFHARQLSNGGEFLTHILLLTKYSSLIGKKPTPSIEADESVEGSAAGHVQLNVDDDDSDVEITEVHTT